MLQGNVDIVALGGSGSFGSMLTGRGDGTFAPVVSFPVTSLSGSHSSAVALADINGDGALDAAIMGRAGAYVNILLSRNSVFANAASIASVPNALSWMSTADVDGDGRYDIVASAYGNGQYLLRGQAGGTLGAAQMIANGTGSWGAAMADLNADGRVDLVVGGLGYAAAVGA